MSLVDYASSSDDDDDDVPKEGDRREQPEEQQIKGPQNQPPPKQPTPLPLPPPITTSPLTSNRRLDTPMEKLPDASFLLGSPAAFPSSLIGPADHASTVAAAMAQSASRKRDGVGPTPPRNKIPRGNLPHSKSVPETEGGLLVPPQLSGRSNVVTEDIGKLFVRRHAESSSS